MISIPKTVLCSFVFTVSFISVVIAADASSLRSADAPTSRAADEPSSRAAEDPKRDKRTVDVLLRGAADLFGYDVVRRISSPSLRQVASTPRPTFFPPPVAPQLPSGTYSRVILALGQQQQQQQQQLQRQLQQAFQVTSPFQPGILAQQQQQPFQQEQQQQQQPVQRTTIVNIPQNGALTASAESLNFPPGSVLPVLHVNTAPAVAQVPLVQTLQAQPVIPVAPVALTAQPFLAQQQAIPQQVAQAPAPQSPASQVSAPQSSATAPQQAAPANQNAPPFGIPLQIVAIAPNAQNSGQIPTGVDAQNVPQNSQAQQQSAQQNAPPQAQPQQQNGSQLPTPAGTSATSSTLDNLLLRLRLMNV